MSKLNSNIGGDLMVKKKNLNKKLKRKGKMRSKIKKSKPKKRILECDGPIVITQTKLAEHLKTLQTNAIKEAQDNYGIAANSTKQLNAANIPANFQIEAYITNNFKELQNKSVPIEQITLKDVMEYARKTQQAFLGKEMKEEKLV